MESDLPLDLFSSGPSQRLRKHILTGDPSDYKSYKWSILSLVLQVIHFITSAPRGQCAPHPYKWSILSLVLQVIHFTISLTSDPFYYKRSERPVLKVQRRDSSKPFVIATSSSFVSLTGCLSWFPCSSSSIHQPSGSPRQPFQTALIFFFVPGGHYHNAGK